MVLETRIIDNMAKGFEANLTLANVGMAIDAGAKLSLGIVEMKGEDLLEADERIDFTDGSIPAFGRADVVACGEDNVWIAFFIGGRLFFQKYFFVGCITCCDVYCKAS